MKRSLLIVFAVLGAIKSSAQMVVDPYRYSMRSYDADAQAYFNALTVAGVTPTTAQKDNVNTFITSQKLSALWSKKAAVYFPVWSNEAANAINMKNPGTYNLSFVGSPTADGSGVDWNGSSQYANTGLNANTLINFNTHLSYYSQENIADGSFRNDMGAYNSSSSNAFFSIKFSTSLQNSIINLSCISGAGSSNPNASGYFIATRIANNDLKFYRNGSSIASQTTASTGTLPNSIIIIGGYNIGSGATISVGSYGIRKCSYASIGTGMTSTEASTDNTQVEALHDAFSIGVQ